jgi:hypothetical protein
MATLNVNFISPSPAAHSAVGETISVWGNVSVTNGKLTKLGSVTVQFGAGGQSVKASINGFNWQCTGNAPPQTANGAVLQIIAEATAGYTPQGFPSSETEGISGAGTLDVILEAQPIATVMNLNGVWASGGVPGPVISTTGNSISVDMSAYGRPTASGSILDSSDISVNFPDDSTYSGKLQAPDTILWSNNSAWTKVATSTNTVFDLNGQWASGGIAGPVISVTGKNISVDMTYYKRPAATGSILDAADIVVTFPDDNTYTGKLQAPGTISWSNNSTWTKVAGVILFQSNFEDTAANQPPSTAQAVGTATFNGPNTVMTSAFANFGNWLQIGPWGQQGAEFQGVFTEAIGTGRYTISATLLISSKPQSAATIGFNSSGNQEFLNIDFSGNKVTVRDQATSCTYPNDQPFSVQAILTVTATSATASIDIAGTVATYNLNTFPGPFGVVTFYQEAGEGQGPFDVTDIVVTYASA